VKYSFLFIILFFSCKHKDSIVKTKIDYQKLKKDSLNKIHSENLSFFCDSLLKNKKWLLKNYLHKYQYDSCGFITYDNSGLQVDFEKPKDIVDINGDKINDTVFLIPPLNYCDDGDSYVFYDTLLPRLNTDSYCCHPDNMFSIGDIDEDGVAEICIFYSSCSSRFKSLKAYTLRNREWEEIGQSLFDVGIMKPDKEKRVRKISKGKFQMLSIEGVLRNGKYVKDSYWETINM
jgi:hypothetical protein